MRLSALLISILLVSLSGCTSTRLRQRTVNQAATLPELQYQQVLDNLALFAENPSALPWHANLREGTTQITDAITGGSLVDLGPPAVTQPEVFGSRTVVGQWGMTPVIDATELRLLRFAYRRAHGSPEMPDMEFLDELAHELKDQMPLNVDLRDESELFFEYQSRLDRDSPRLDAAVVTTNDSQFLPDPRRSAQDVSPLARNVHRQVESILRDLAKIHPGWFHVGRKRDIPKDACYVGRSGKSYVWVCADGREALTQFTLTVLKLSELIKETQTLISPGSVKFSPGDARG